MTTRMRVFLPLACLAALILSDPAAAAPRRWARRANGTYATYASGGLKEIAAKSDPESAGYRVLRAYYSYDKALAEEAAFTDRLRVFLLVRDETVWQSTESIVAEVKLIDLRDPRATHVRYCPLTFNDTTNPDFRLGVFEVADAPGESPVIRPARVYRLFVNLHRAAASYGPDTVIGQVPLPYYVATGGEDRLGRARRHIAMRTFKEFYYAQQGWRREGNYPMDCYAYYMWATGSCTVGSQNGMTLLHRLFGGRRPFQGGSDIARLARQDSLHGDYVRIPGHSFMLLAYDGSSGHVWTMEGNFNSTIEIVKRSIDGSWTVGHLVDEHVRPELFQVSHAARDDAASRPRL